MSEGSGSGVDSDSDQALQQCQTLLASFADGIYQLDADGRFVTVNDEFAEFVGHDRNDLLGEDLSLVLNDADFTRFSESIDTLQDGRAEEIDVTLPLLTANGETVACEHRLTRGPKRERTDGRGVVGAVHVPDDEDELGIAPPDQTLAAVLNEAEVGVFVLDAGFEVAWTDETIERYFGVDREAVIGRDKRQLIEETIAERIADGETFKDTVFATYDDNTYLEQFECRVTAGDDREERWIEHLSKPIESGPYAGGRVELYYDITEQRRRASQLEKLHEAVREWLAASSREEAAELASGHLTEILNLDVNGVFLYDERAEVLRPVSWTSRAETLFGEIPSFTEGDSIAWRAFETGEPEIHDDVRSDPDIYDPDTPIHSEIILPLGDYGVVIMGSERRGAFDDDLTLARIAASNLEATFDRLRRERDLEHERGLRQMKERFEKVFENSLDAIFVADPHDDEFVDANPAACEMLGYDREELLAIRPSDVHARELDEFAAFVDAVYETGSARTEELTCLTSAGRELPAEISASTVEFDGRELLLAIVRDLSDRMIRERRLEQYRALTEAANDVIVTIDTDSTIQMVNPAVREVFGYDPEELIGESLTRLMPDGFGDRHQPALDRYLETDERTLDWNYVEFPGLTAEGEELPLGISFDEAVYDGERYFTGIVRDITERERRARQQQAVADLGQLALETDDLDHLMHKAARKVADVLGNEYCKVLDLDPDERELLLRQGVGWDDEIVGEVTVSSVEADSQAAHTLANEHPIVVEDLETETRFSGPELLRSHDVRSGISTIIGSIDEPWGILGTHDTDRREFTEEDVSFVQSVANVLAEAIERHRYQDELEELIAELEESNERLEQFAYAASHDLQEPLRMVTSYLQLLENRYGDELDDDAEEFIEFAVDGAERMREMIDGLLAYSRVDTRGAPFESVDLEDVFEETLENLQVRIEESDAEITAEELPRVYGDESQLRQVFQNVLENAIQYSGDEPPRVHISADRRGREWVISVRDEGIGIDPDDADQIFEVFQRLHSREDQEGTGIGLALCKRIVERHGGDVWVDSEPGDGATFSFALPAADSHD